METRKHNPSTCICRGKQLPRRDRPSLLLRDRAQLVVQPSPPLRRIPRVRPDVVPKVREVRLFVYSGPGILFVRRLERGIIGAVRVVLAGQRVFVFSPDLGAVVEVQVVSIRVRLCIEGDRSYMTSGMALCASIMPLYVLVESIVYPSSYSARICGRGESCQLEVVDTRGEVNKNSPGSVARRLSVDHSVRVQLSFSRTSPPGVLTFSRAL